MKKAIRVILIVLLVLVLLIAAFFAYLTATQLNPEKEPAELTGSTANSVLTVHEGDSISVMSWNVGYAALGEESDFFMDGGTQTRPESSKIIDKNLSGISNEITQTGADFTILQEVDSGSTRSYGVMETDFLTQSGAIANAYTRNYKCAFVPFPWPPLGNVSSGLLTLSGADIASAQRVALPSPFKWPVSTANLKRCLLVSRIPLEGSEHELVLVNLHLEAYDDGAGKAAQTKVLTEFLQSEYDKGNYVIAGGDFNQTFPGGLDSYPIKDAELWTPGTLDATTLPGDGWQFAYDVETPTCRLLNQPYDPASEATQYYVIDGFILSPNVMVSAVQTLDKGFQFSDHNPVLLNVQLG